MLMAKIILLSLIHESLITDIIYGCDVAHD